MPEVSTCTPWLLSLATSSDGNCHKCERDSDHGTCITCLWKHGPLQKLNFDFSDLIQMLPRYGLFLNKSRNKLEVKLIKKNC